MLDMQVQSPVWEDSLKEEVATYSRTLAWKIPWMEEPDRLQSMGVTKSLSMNTNIQFVDFKYQYIHSVVQPSPQSTSRTFPSSLTENLLNNHLIPTNHSQTINKPQVPGDFYFLFSMNIQYLSFCSGLFHSACFLRFIHFAAYIRIPLFFKAE